MTKKAYWIAHVTVTDPAPYALYAAAATACFAKYGARVLARGGQYVELEGALGRARHVVIEFDSYQAALDCYHSPEYQAAKAHREGAGIASVTIVEAS